MQTRFICYFLPVSLVSFVSMLVNAVRHAITSTHTLFFFLPSIIFDNLFLPFIHQVKESIDTQHERKKTPKHSFSFNEKTNSANRFHTKFISCQCWNRVLFYLSFLLFFFFLHNIVHASDSLPAVLNCIQCSYVVNIHLSFQDFFKSFFYLKDMSKDVRQAS